MATRLIGFLRPTRADEDFRAELEAHVDLHTEANIRAGLSPEEARRRALIRLGGAEQTRQAHRERRTLPWLESLNQDLRFTMRQLRRHRGSALTVIATLALGIGASTMMFTVVNDVLLKPLPYPHPERILLISSKYTGGPDYRVIRAAQFRFLQAHSRTFESLALSDTVPSGVNISGDGQPEQLKAVFVSAGFFKVLGVTPALGRAFTAAEERPGGACAVILTDGVWRSRYNANRSILANPITVNRESCAVVGVLPAAFRFHLDSGVFLPLRIDPAPRDLGHYYNLLARLRTGETLQQARQELTPLFAQFKADYGDLVDDGEVGFEVQRYQDVVLGRVRPTLWVLFGAVSLMLLIACVNVAHLQVSRGAARTREMAVRAALGAGRMRLARQLITENALLAIAGAASGLSLAYIGLPLLLHLSPSGLPRANDISVDLPVVAFAAALSALTLIAFGAAPAISGSRAELCVDLKSSIQAAKSGRSGRLAQDLLIVCEVALSLTLLAGAILLIRSFVGLKEVDPGFNPRNLLVFKMSIPPGDSTTSRTWEFERQVTARLDALPGVNSAASATCLPLEAGPDMPGVLLGQSLPRPINPAYRPVSPAYFQVLGTPLIRGRSFTGSDAMNAPPVAIINESLARQAFAGQDPIGQKLQLGIGLGTEYADQPRVIVGVAEDVRESRIETPAAMTVFIPRAQIPPALTPLMNRVLPISWAVRTRIPPAQLAAPIRRALLAIDSQQPPADIRTMEQVLSSDVDRQRFALVLMTIFASLATAMAAVGIYGVAGCQMQQRTREIGIRMALGAQRATVMMLVVRRTAFLLIFGVIAGVACSWMAARAIKSMLFGIGPHDLVTIVAASMLLVTCGLIAAFIPARRAASIDPIQALRTE
jgi:predicted permease